MKKPNIFKRVVTLFRSWYEQSFMDYELQGKTGVVVTNWLREQLDKGNPEAVAYYANVASEDPMIEKGKLQVFVALQAYAKAHNLPVEGKTRIEVVRTVFSHLRSLKSRRSFWVEISGDLIVFLADRKIDWNEAVILGQKIFWQLFSKTRKLAVEG